MREINLEELKKLQLDILCNVHDFCVKNGITYFLSSGTLIGAIRHKGYIPWDDDIDIAMPRPDYDRFFSTYKDDNYKALDFEKDKEWPYTMGKVYDTRTTLTENALTYKHLGVFIDVFPIDGLPESSTARKLHLMKISTIKYLFLQKVFSPERSSNSMKELYHRTFRFVLRPLPLSAFLSKLCKSFRRYDWGAASYVASLATANERIPCEKVNLASTTEKDFEGHTVFVPVGYDTWLRLIYGDYMQLPPISKRIAHHGIKAYWK